MSPRRRPAPGRRWAVLALFGLLVLLWLATAAPGGIGVLEVLAGLSAAGAGAVIAGRRAVETFVRARWPHRAARGTPHPGPGSPDAPTGDEIGALLDRLAPGLGAVRLVVWGREEDGRLHPMHSSTDTPSPIDAAGDPLAWALDHGQPLRIEDPPRWARGPVTAAPLPGGRVLTAEGEAFAPLPDAVVGAARVVASFAAMAEREERSAAQAARFRRFLAFLKSLPGGADAERFPEELAAALAEIADADGAAVAGWEEDRGRVLARWGSGGGPAAGTYFSVMDGDFAMAARAGTPIERTPGARAPVLAHAGERWSPVPDYLTVVPLVDASGPTRGIVALWGARPPADGAIELVTALAPLLALQLQHTTDLVRFRQRAHEDVLTGLRNRAALEERIADERNRFHRYRRPVSLLVLDLDHFKAINDTHGHPAGDAVLERVSEILRATIRDADFAARFGGEELVVLLPETMRREAGEVAERVRAAIAAAAVEWAGKTIPVTASIGVSSCPEIVPDPGDLLRSADAALYESKGGGRNRVTVALSATSGG